MEHLTKESFMEKVFNFEKNQEWTYEGKNPCVIDFYADWCGPCKMVGPIMEELAKDYEGKVDIYKINTEEQQEPQADVELSVSRHGLDEVEDGIDDLDPSGLLEESRWLFTVFGITDDQAPSVLLGGVAQSFQLRDRAIATNEDDLLFFTLSRPDLLELPLVF